MPAKKTVVIFVHGANQRKKSDRRNKEVWQASFQLNAQLLPLLIGKNNKEIAEFHQKKDPQRNFPKFIGWDSAWYGSLYKNLK